MESNLYLKAYKIARKNFSNKIFFFIPGLIKKYETSFFTGNPKFPAISITGTQCWLNCQHCRGKLLENMLFCTNPQQLYNLCLEIYNQGGDGCLISGGCLPNGQVPLDQYLEVIKKVKSDLNLELVLHTGILSKTTIERLASINVGAVMFDVIGDKQTLEEIYNLKIEPRIYSKMLALLEEKDIPVVPHIVIGLYKGIIKGEKNAINIIMEHKHEAIVFVIIMPLDKVDFQIREMNACEIGEIILYTRLNLPNTPLILGCAKPFGELREKIEILAIKAGINGIAYPTEASFQFSKKLRLKPVFYQKCCSLMYKEIKMK